ncbi:MAG: sugar ABC transporter permease [Caldilineaceae bacterium]|nr:sugar ABC transporter permease [Caldilineaceae bacterium]
MAVAQDQIKMASPNNDAGLLGKIVGAKTRFQTQRALWGYVFALPWILGLVIFWGGPILASFYFSFTNYEIIGSSKFVGLDNYIRVFTRDPLFWPSMGRTFTFTALYVPAVIIGALLLAVLLNQKLWGTNYYRTVFFMPHLIPAVALAVLWIYLMQPRMGPINTTLRSMGIDNPPSWLASKDSALYAVTLILVWAGIGGNTMIIFLAGLQGVPQELYEAASMDGANAWSKFRNVTLPLLTPTIFFNLVLAVIAALKVFGTAWVATQGGPSYATWFIAMHIFVEAFQYFRLGYGSALAWILAVIILVFTWVQVRGSRRWVHYEGG